MDLVHEMLATTALARPDAHALRDRVGTLTYADLATAIEAAASGLIAQGLRRTDRVVVWLPKCSEAVVAIYATMRAGGIAVPVNPLLKAPQALHMVRDSGARFLVTTAARMQDLEREAEEFSFAVTGIIVDKPRPLAPTRATAISWSELLEAPPAMPHKCIDTDVAALFYTSGSTGRPKGVVTTHRNMVVGARSVSRYLDNTPDDRLLAVLSLGFDYGFSQVTTAFAVGASVVLLDYALPQEVLMTLEREQVTGLAAVPPIWIQLADLPWPADVAMHLRYATNSGGVMPRATLSKLRRLLPRTRIFLMYGLTEAFRSTYLPPEELDNRPDSIGKEIPGAEILVLRNDGTPCEADEPGELVHRGSLVSLGYWNDAKSTAERFRPIPTVADGVPLPEIAVWSGDFVRRDSDGYLYFIGRRDDLIKTSGYRVSPTEIEEEAYATGLVTDAVAIGVPHPLLGQGIVLVVSPAPGADADSKGLLGALRLRLPRFMVPLVLDWRETVTRNANGKFDRERLRYELAQRFEYVQAARPHGPPGPNLHE